MKAVHIDFATKRPPPRWVWVLLGLLGIVTLAAAGAAWKTHGQANRLRSELAALAYSKQLPVPTQTRTAVEPPYASSAREMLQEALSPWPATLTALENTRIPGVTIVSLELLPREKQLRLEVQFTDYATLLNYLERLSDGESRPTWSLLQAQATAKGVPGQSMAMIGRSLGEP